MLEKVPGAPFEFICFEPVPEPKTVKNRVHIDVFDYTGSRLLDSWNDAAEFPVRSASGEIGQGFVQLRAEYRLE